jgi:hypothetical protein
MRFTNVRTFVALLGRWSKAWIKSTKIVFKLQGETVQQRWSEEYFRKSDENSQSLLDKKRRPVPCTYTDAMQRKPNQEHRRCSLNHTNLHLSIPINH